MMINHVKSHAEKRKRTKCFTLPETLNSRVDSIILEKATKPINSHIINTSIAVYVDHNYHPNNYSSAIKLRSGETTANEFMMNKYGWNTTTIKNIAWKYHATSINSQSHSTQKNMRKFVHRWLSSGSHNRCEALICPYCALREDDTMGYDYLLQCSSSTIKKERLDSSERLLNQLHTPQQLITPIIKGIENFYNNQDFQLKEKDPKRRTKDHHIIGDKTSEIDFDTCILHQNIIG